MLKKVRTFSLEIAFVFKHNLTAVSKAVDGHYINIMQCVATRGK